MVMETKSVSNALTRHEGEEKHHAIYAHDRANECKRHKEKVHPFVALHREVDDEVGGTLNGLRAVEQRRNAGYERGVEREQDEDDDPGKTLARLERGVPLSNVRCRHWVAQRR